MTDAERRAYLTSAGFDVVALEAPQPSPSASPLTDEERMAFLQESGLMSSAESPTESGAEFVPSTRYGVFGSIPSSAYAQGERNVAGNVLERPAAALRGFVRGLPPGGVSPREGYRQGALNPAAQPPFPSLQQAALDAYYRTVLPNERPSFITTMGGMVPSAVGLAGDVAVNIATNPAEAIGTLLPFLKPVQMAGKAVAATKPGRAIGQFFTKERHLRRVSPNTLSQLMQVPESRVAELTLVDQRKWFQIRREQQLASLNQQGRVLKEQRKVLNRELGKAAQQRSLEIRQRLPELFHDQSVQYRRIYDAEFAEHAGKFFEDDALRAFVEQRLKADPEQLADVSARLGLSNKPAEPVLSNLVDEFGRPVLSTTQPSRARTFGQLRQQAKDYGQSLPASVRESLRTYTADEAVVDETLDTIAAFMESQGISLKESNRFWAEWKPIQRQATAEFRPYNLVGTRTQVASNRLKKLAKGIDPDNDVYASKLADYLGIDSLPGDLKKVVARLDANQKDLLAIQLQQQEVRGVASPLAQAQYVAGKRHEQSLEKWNRVYTLLKWVLGGAAAGAGASVAKSALRR